MTTPPEEPIDIWKELNKLYEKSDRSLLADIEYHLKYGYIFSSPEYLLMGFEFEGAWIVHVAIGRNCLSKFISCMPYYLPYIGWSRDPSGRGELKLYETDKLVKHL